MEEDIEDEVMFKVSQRAKWLLESPEYAGLTQKHQIARRTQLVAAWLIRVLQEEM